MTRPPVPTSVRPLTDLDARELLAKPLLALCSDHGPTRVGRTIGCHEKTVRDARDEKSLLGMDLAANLLILDPAALDPMLAHFGLCSAPLATDTDSDRSRESSVLKAALALSVALSDDNEITPDEVRANRDTIKAARDALDGLLRKIVRAA